MIDKILKNVRKTRGLTQANIGKKLNFADNTISGYETGKTNPTFITIKKFLDVCNFDMQFIDKENERVYTIEELSKEMDF